MSRRQSFTCLPILSIGLILLAYGPSHADEILFDDFSDGPTESWVTGGNDLITFEDEGLVLSAAGVAWAGIVGLALEDTSVRARVRVTEGAIVGIAARWRPETNYYGFFGNSGNSMIGIGSRTEILANGFSKERNTLSDVILQLDIIGDQIDFWAWHPGEPMPNEPLVSAEHQEVTEGDFYIWAAGSENFDPIGPVALSIRYVEVADERIVTGDFDHNQVLDVGDLQDLTVALRNNNRSLRYDINDDEAVDERDRQLWVKGLKKTYFGDADLDGRFNSRDLVSVLAAGEYEDDIVGNSGWATGDWDGDGEFTSADVLVAFVDGGYDQDTQPAVAVPEPAGGLSVALSLLWLSLRPRREA